MQTHARALTKDYKLKVIWTKLPEGANAGYDWKSNTILMPAVNVPMLTQEQADKLKALSYHERKHHALTECPLMEEALKTGPDGKIDEKLTTPNEILKNLLNCLEDARIEMSPHYFLPGDQEDLIYYRKVLNHAEYEGDKWNVLQYMNPWGALMMAYKFRLPDYFTLSIIPELQKYFDLGWNILQDGRFETAVQKEREGTKIVLQLAKEILEAWKMEVKEDKNFKKVRGNGKSDDLILGEGEGEGEGNGDGDGEGEGEDNSEGSSQGEVDNINGQFRKDQKKNNGKYAVDPDQLNKEMGDLAREKSGSGKEGRTPNYHMNQIDNDTAYVPYDPHDRTVVAKQFPNEYLKFRKDIEDKIVRARKELTKSLVALTQDEKLIAQKKGKLDPRRLSTLLTGSDRVFSRKRDALRIKSAVQLVIDLSGSMSGPKAELATQVATLFAETLHVLKVPFEIIGFNTDDMRENHCDLEKEGYTRNGDIINRWIFKTFSENFYSVRDRLGACARDMDTSDKKSNCGAIGGCNIDHEVILWGAARLWNQHVDRRIQIILSDGLPSGFLHTYGGLLPRLLKESNQKIERHGIEQFCFGIMNSEVKHYYSKYKIINNLNDMNVEALRFLATSLKYRSR